MDGFAGVSNFSDLESKFAEMVIWYNGFKDDRVKLLAHDPIDRAIIVAKMNDARADKDFKTSDFLRDVLRRAGLDVKNKA